MFGEINLKLNLLTFSNKFCGQAFRSSMQSALQENRVFLSKNQKKRRIREIVSFFYLQSIIRICFHERRLQYMEKEQISAWQASRPGERIVELDVPLSYGLFDIEQDPKTLNMLSFLWDPTKEVGAYIKVRKNKLGKNTTASAHTSGEKRSLNFTRISASPFDLCENSSE